MSEAKDAKMKDLLEQLEDIRKLLIISVIRSGMKTDVLAEILGYKHERSLSNEFSIKRIRENARVQQDED